MFRNLIVSSAPKCCLVLAPQSRQSCKLILLHAHMSLQTNCTQFRAVGTLPVSGFVSEDTLGLGSILSRCFLLLAKENTHNWGMTYQIVG